MDYNNIDVNSMQYRKLTKEEKLKVVNSKISSLISKEQKANTTGVYYKKELVYVSKEKEGVLRDLVERQKHLEKYLYLLLLLSYMKEKEVNKDETKKTNIEDIKLTSLEYKNASFEEKLAIINAKKKFFKYYISIAKDNCEEYEKAIKILDEMQIYLLIDMAKENLKERENKKDKLDEEIKTTKKEIYNLLELYKDNNYANKKIIAINYNGERRYLPYSKIGEYKILSAKLKELEKERRALDLENNSKTDENKDNIIKDEVVDTPIRNTKDDKDASSNVVIEDKNTPKNEIIKAPSKDIIDVPYEDVVDVSLKDKKKSIKNKLSGLLLGIPFVSKIKNKFNNLKEKIKNRKTRDNLSDRQRKEKRKRYIAAFCSAVIIITSALGIKSFKSKKKVDNTPKKETYSTIDNKNITNQNDQTIIQDKDVNVKEEDIIIEDTASHNNEYSFGDIVTIKDDAAIYNNCYDGTYQTNKLNPLFSGDYERTVRAIVYSLDGKIYTVFKDDEYANEKVSYLRSHNAKETAVIVTRSDLLNYTNDYEGCYNISDIETHKTLTKTR